MARCRRPERELLRVSILLCGLLGGATPALSAGAPVLRFSLRSEPVASRDLASLRRDHAAHSVRVFEPYEEGEARFLAFSFAEVLDEVYGARWREEQELLFTCRDGYQPTLPVGRLLTHSSWLAFQRLDQDGFTILKLESGSRKRIELGPFYLIWDNLGDEQLRLDGDYGWPYQLVGVDLIRSAERFPLMVPPQGSGSEALAGFAEFRIHCSRCHAINGEGGRVGADLNQPTNPVEYRDREWLRRWIDDPARILPTARMPRLNPALPDRGRVIDRILAYLQAMSRARRSAQGESPDGR